MTSDAGVPGAPRFDVVLRGYDRRQVDDHVDRLQRVLGRMRADLDVARSQPPPPPIPVPQAAPRPRPTPRPRPDAPLPAGGASDTIGDFTDRMQSILQAAEEEAAEIRRNAQRAARAETDGVRAQLADLTRQRDAVLAELTRMRGQLEGLLAAPTAAMPSREGPRPAPVRPVDGPAGAAQPGTTSGGKGTAAAGPQQAGLQQPGPPQGGPGQPGPQQAGRQQGGAPQGGPTQGGPAQGGPAHAGSPQGGPQQGGAAPTKGPGPSQNRPAAASPRPAAASAPTNAHGTAGETKPGPTSPQSGRPTHTPDAGAQRSGASGAPRPTPKPAPPASTADATDESEPAARSGREAGNRESGKRESGKAAHRLPTGAYPMVGEQPGSLRPRSEPQPEPGELFRSAIDRNNGPRDDEAEPRTTAVAQQPAVDAPAAGKDESGGDRTAMVPSVSPRGSDKPQPGRTGAPGDVESTVAVGAVRPGDPTVMAPVPTTARPEGRDDESPPEPRKTPSGRPVNGQNGSNRSTSTSRSG